MALQKAGKGTVTSAVIFVKSTDFDPHATRCVAYCEERGYHLTGLIQDDWSAVVKTLAAGEAEVVVVSEERHLDPDRRPRIEIVAHQVAAPIRAQRTRIIRRAWVR